MSSQYTPIEDFTTLKLPLDTQNSGKVQRDTNEQYDPAFLNDNPDFKAARDLVNLDVNNLQSWDYLIKLTEQLITKYPSPTEIIKKSIEKTFDELLERFPLLFGYWKKYVALMYQISGVETSLEILSKSIDAFPHSIDLWTDYMTLLISNKGDDTTKIIDNFKLAVSFVGHNFLSSPVWDLYLNFQENHGTKEDLVKILLKLIRIPLHQYTRYFEYFTKVKSSIDIDTLIDLEGEDLNHAKGIENQEEKLNAVNEYFMKVNQVTQGLVYEIWSFESQIKQSYFTLIAVSIDEVNNWDIYLNFLISKHQQSSTDLIKSQIISTFERSLIPTAFSPVFWKKYLNWYLDQYPEEFDEINNIYIKCVNVFLPIQFIDLRLNYALFLRAHEQQENKIHDVYLSVISYVPNETKPVIQYIRYISSSNSDYQKTASQLEDVLNSYYRKGQQRQIDFKIQRFVDKLNSKTIAIVIIELLKINLYFIKNHLNVKKALNYYSRLEDLSGSVIFWSFTYKYYKQYRDFRGLAKVIEFIKLKSTLPITTINLLLEDYTEFLATNHDETASIFDIPNYSNIILTDYEKSTQLGFRGKTDQQQRKRQKRQSGHPGVFTDKPEVTNTIVDQLAPRYRPASLPTFKNAEKASLPIEYQPDE
ncbi:Pre-mRNA-processing factor 39 [Wickerhamomyces ciferrii]|uniref:Pre-mRNA-processing factor 39 n=1 Tax=Wickerhamomyces ciferrii (strain ATCC 14091 / BCRC 22168 / CBS 111 / JCM 3599 / NBRC 0793 / NRRL Y-1031 F-60-10) TaxID=1206466 RepID=K0KP12_WICCF|nr:Pre-mRNA-processing factor 39 [Wickerhamomyces ciferrii]CCH44701.1 Pre-mRNA-processing factor 39 [Wickerhamomyces ciferrii]